MPLGDASSATASEATGSQVLPDGFRRLFGGARRVADRLADALMEALSPLCSRWIRSLRLVAVLEPDGTLRLYRVAGDVATELGGAGELDAAARTAIAGETWTAVEVHLAPCHVLRRSVRLPEASRGFLDSIIEHRLERLTPWRPDRILYAYRVSAPTPGDAAGDPTIGLDFVAVPRDLVAKALRVLEALGLSATAVGPGGTTPIAPLALELRGDWAEGTATRFRSTVVLGWGGLTVVLIVATLASLVWASWVESGLDTLDGKLVAARRTLRTLKEQGSAGAPDRLILQEKSSGASILLLIDRLGTVVPDGSHLRELQITRDSVRLLGQSRDAPSLIVRLEGAGLAKVRFSAPVTRDPGGYDSFEITADRLVSSHVQPEAQ